MNTTIPSRRAAASNPLPLHPAHRILAAGLSALLALSIQLASTAHADPPPVTLTRLHSFGTPLTFDLNPSNPSGQVIEGSDGAIYGTTTRGGTFDSGTVFRVNKDGSGLAVLKSLKSATDGAIPYAALTEGSDGALYGNASQGGTFGAGTVFRVNKDGGGFAVLKSFDSATDGASIGRGLTEGSDGALYGTTPYGGSYGYGTLFRMNKDGSGFAVLRSFDYGTDGGYSSAGLTEGSDGALYGTATSGGNASGGTLFRVNKDGSGFTVLKSFDDFLTDGANPNTRVTEGTDGALYGTTYYGGAYGSGTVFRMNKDGSGFVVIKSFDVSTVGCYLTAAGDSEGRDGALSGTTSQGGTFGYGTVFRVNKDGGSFAVLKGFDFAPDGANNGVGLTEGSDGALYAATFGGGTFGAGTVFRMNKDGSGFAVLTSFNVASSNSAVDGATPYAALTEGSDGALYGTAWSGGTSSGGTVFRVYKDGSGFAVLKSFDFNTDGANPAAGVTEGSDGALYGTAIAGGTANGGTLFRVNKDGSGFSVLKNFDSSTDGAVPVRLIESNDGVLYGTTRDGGAHGGGTVFRMNKDGSGFAVLKNFDSSTDGANPFPGLSDGSDGALYGAANAGGAFGYGTVFRLNRDGSDFAVLKSFDLVTGGAYPNGGVIEGSDGALYGTTVLDQTSSWGGTVYRLNKDGSGFAVLKTLDPASDGAIPVDNLIEGRDGMLYGIARDGGAHGGGTVFRMNRDGSGFEVLQAHGLADEGPRYPYGKVVFGSDGRLYGTSSQGGDLNLGTVFALQIGAPNQPPALLNPGNQTVIEGTALAFTLAATDPNAADTLTYSILSGAEPGMNLGASGGDFAWTPSEAQGPGIYAVTFRVTDSGGLAADQSITISVNDGLVGLSFISPTSATANGSGFTLTVNGSNFDPGTVLSWNGAARPTTYISPSQVTAQISATDLQVTGDFVTALVTVTKSTGASSSAVAFTIIGTSISGAVGQVDTSVASAGETVSVQTPPTAPDSAGVTAALENSTGTTPATVTAATYTENPTPAAAFEAGGGFVDLQVSGADAGDRLTSSFYYPQIITGGAEDALMLKFFNGSQWLDVLSSGGIAPAKNTQDNLDGTVSGGRFQVLFDNTSTPQITELNGTVFAVAVPDTTQPAVTCPNITVPANVNLLVPVTYPAPTVSDNIDPAPRVTYSIPSGSGFPIGATVVTCTATDAAGNTASTTFTVTRASLEFDGFAEPIDGADTTGGSYANPARTLKLGNKIRISFDLCGCGSTADTEPHRCCGERHSRHSGHHCSGAHVTTGIHTLQVIKWTSQTDSETPLDADSADARTEGNQFRLVGHKWVFVLDTRDTGMSRGRWQIVATLSDGSQHTAWVQMK